MKLQKLENIIRLLRKDKHMPDPQIKSVVMAYALANSFHHTNRFILRYGIGFAMFLVFGTAGTVFSAQSAQPGETLYAVKRASETAYVKLQPSADAKSNVHEVLINRRFTEAVERVDRDLARENIAHEDILLNDIKLADEAAKESDFWIEDKERVISRMMLKNSNIDKDFVFDFESEDPKSENRGRKNDREEKFR